MEKVNLGRDHHNFKSTIESTNKFSYSKDIIYGCSWPQRNFRCSFCKKEFKSAQALGGHMNIHRRDRAKMRLSSSSSTSSSWDGLNNQNPKPNSPHEANPNPNPNISSLLTSSSHVSSFMKSSVASPFSASKDKEKVVSTIVEKRAFPQMEELKSLEKRNYSRVWKKREMVRVGFQESAKDGLDLELRLGYS